ncbi:MAG: RNA-binding transcriptional accessory protein [Cytophagales bacterium]|nr:MAG: RNA-binding transcriptional accessory protein [Cytophagales bacterium]
MNTEYHIEIISKELSISEKFILATVKLIEEGGTVPFISRYRKEATGSMDEVAVAYVRDRIEQLRDLDKRRVAILKSINEQQKMTPELEAKIQQASTLVELEDIYLPYKPKRRTKATIAKEKGLEPLAKLIFDQLPINITEEAVQYINLELGVSNIEEALAGAKDIMAEWVSEHQECRAKVRNLFSSKGVYKSKVITGKEKEGEKFKDYFDCEEALAKAPSHRVLAMRRGEKEMVLILDILPPEEECIMSIEKLIIQSKNESAELVKSAIKDSFKRLIKPSIETEIRMLSKKKADEEAIKVFAENLKLLLLAAPLGQKNVLAIDPGFRTGCKVVALDKQGKLLEYIAIFPHEPQLRVSEAQAIIKLMCDKYQIQAIAIGNGTAGRETETFVRNIQLPSEIQIILVNESGASIYSASETAREEFPDQDITVRGAVSIGRRLMDPLAELVKIDPKSIGVGQYQHDVDQMMLKQSLDDIVINAVNKVGVEINTASKEILTYISGLGPQLAKNIVEFRNEHGPFKSRSEIKKVSRMGDKAYEQAAGFLRIYNATNPLDSSAVHPESYSVVEQMTKDLNCSVMDLIQKEELRKRLDLKKYASEQIGLPTLNDILQELAKPGRDPREKFEVFKFQEGVNKIEDLRIGMELPGIITNVTKFGAFVDIGVHQDGLVHVSQLADRFVSDASEIVKVQQKVKVKVVELDISRKRISLSMKLGLTNNSIKETNTRKSGKESSNNGGDMQEKLNMLLGKFK